MSRGSMSRGDGEGAAEAPPSHENMHVHQQDSPHGLSSIVSDRCAPWCLLWHLQEPEKKGGVPLLWRHLVLRGDGDGPGMRLLQVPVVTAPQCVCPFCYFHCCHFCEFCSSRSCRSEIPPRRRAPPFYVIFFFFLPLCSTAATLPPTENHKRKKWDTSVCCLTERNIL